jgi:hypothetical protein
MGMERNTLIPSNAAIALAGSYSFVSVDQYRYFWIIEQRKKC